MSAELAARRTAAAALVADFRLASDQFLKDNTGTLPEPHWSTWSVRLASMLDLVLDAPDPAAAKLAKIRGVLHAFDWETDDRQYALERIDAIVNRSRS